MPSKNSKNRKKSWKKIVGTGEVNNYFSNVNFDIRFGGSINSRPDTQLFKLSKAPHESSAPLTAPTKIQKSCIHFYPDTSVQPIKLPTRSPRQAANSALCKKRAIALRPRAQPQIGKKRARLREWEMFRNPLWTDESPPAVACDSDFPQHVEEIVRPRRVRVPDSLLSARRERPLVPAVLLPDPGASYRPGEEEHGRLLERVERGEARRLRAERRVRNSLRGMRRLSAREMEREKERQMMEGLGEVARRSDSGESDGSTAAPAAINTRKKKKKKRKGIALERKKETLERDKRRLEKRQSEDIRNIVSLTKRLDSEVSIKRKRSAPLTKKLGRLRYREAPRDFQLSSEIAASLRGLVSEGSLLRDRYKSLQKRNIIEVRRKFRGKRKYKLKTFVKNSYKEDT